MSAHQEGTTVIQIPVQSITGAAVMSDARVQVQGSTSDPCEHSELVRNIRALQGGEVEDCWPPHSWSLEDLWTAALLAVGTFAHGQGT